MSIELLREQVREGEDGAALWMTWSFLNDLLQEIDQREPWSEESRIKLELQKREHAHELELAKIQRSGGGVTCLTTSDGTKYDTLKAPPWPEHKLGRVAVAIRKGLQEQKAVSNFLTDTGIQRVDSKILVVLTEELNK